MAIQVRKTVALTEQHDRFIAGQIERGEFDNESAVVRAGLRLLEQEQFRVAALRQAIAEGDADFAAGRFSTYEAGDAMRELQHVISAETAD